MKKTYKNIALFLISILVISSEFYAQDNSNENAQHQTNINNEQNQVITKQKFLFFTFQTSLGRGGYSNYEFGTRLAYYFFDSRIYNIGINFSLCYSNEGNISDSHSLSQLNYSRTHYLSLSLLPSFFVYGYYMAGGIGVNFKFAGPEKDFGPTNSVTYNKTYYIFNIEMGYLYVPKNNNKFTFAIVLYGKISLSKRNIFQYYIDKEKGGTAGIRIQLGLNLL